MKTAGRSFIVVCLSLLVASSGYAQVDTPTNTRTSTPTATPTSTATSTSTRTLTPTKTKVPTRTRTSTATATATSTRTGTATLTGTPTQTATAIPTNTARGTFTSPPTKTPTSTPTITNTPTRTLTVTITATPTNTPTVTATSTSTPVGRALALGATCASAPCDTSKFSAKGGQTAICLDLLSGTISATAICRPVLGVSASEITKGSALTADGCVTFTDYCEEAFLRIGTCGSSCTYNVYGRTTTQDIQWVP